MSAFSSASSRITPDRAVLMSIALGLRSRSSFAPMRFFELEFNGRWRVTISERLSRSFSVVYTSP